MRVPRTPRNLASQEWREGQGGPWTRLHSDRASFMARLTYVPQARVTSGPVAGYALHFFPVRTPAAARTCAAWQIAAMGLLAFEKWWTISMTRGIVRMYSGARPPGIIRALYSSGLTSSKVALRAKLCPRFSV